MTDVPRKLSLWVAPSQEDLARQLISALPLGGGGEGSGGVAIGSSVAGAAAAMAATHNAEVLGDDLRAALAKAEPGAFIIASPGAFASHGEAAQRVADHDLMASSVARGVQVTAFEPLPGSLIHLLELAEDPTSPEATPLVMGPIGSVSQSGVTAANATGRVRMWAVQSPLTRYCAPVAAALDVMEQFGPVRSMSVECLGSPAHGSLGARLFDALDLAHLFLGEPEAVDANYADSADGVSLRPLPGDTLRGLTGEVAASLRYSASRCASLLASSNAGAYRVRVTLIGPGGRITLGTEGFEWVDVKGTVVDRSTRITSDKRAGTAGARPAVNPDVSAFVAMAADVVSRLAEGEDLGSGRGSPAGQSVLAMAQAALLSARTGEAESPATMLRMAGG